MGKKNIPREKIILWNKGMLEKMEKENYARGIIWAHINIANQCWNLGNGEESIKNLNIAESLLHENEGDIDFFTIAKLYQEYSQAYYTMKLYDTGLKYNSKGCYYGNKIEDKDRKGKFLSYVYTTRADFLYEKKDLDSALYYLKQSSLLYESLNTTSQIANHYIEYQPSQDAAKTYLEQGMDIINKKKHGPNSYQISVFYYYYAQYFFKEKNYEKAIVYLDKALEYNKKLTNIGHSENIYKLLISCYKKSGNLEKEKEYLEYYIKLKDSLENSQTKGVELSIKTIEKEKTEEKKALKKTIFIYSSIVIAIGLVLLAYLYYQNNKKKKVILESKEIISRKEDETKVLERRISGVHEDLIQLAKNNDISFLEKFHEVYPNVSQKLLAINPDLTKDNLMFCALIWLGFSSKDIAEFTFMQHRSVQIKKSRLRKKLNLGSDVDLYQFLKSLIDN
ncbi:LuxR C-terminal-related transcriptional regulator [Chryseobacterium sp. WLY505]|uniref:LuxR C-terminal-related transcriptional regulator n=1 Tax=Chryseobacterium sp. WLY505 TaxID=3068892 RepID=UPI002796BE36|nr:LuxR C-terminal-related transcriptional regulator [Chryseobacterium sp. WLY505]MDQ1855233.1 LuxR C-terminal-related transcriptional regulator [Chryseobacterium sp. WLY505]